MNYLINSYARLNIHFSYGQGVYLFDTKGNRYFDAITGIGVNALGHGHRDVVQTISKQVQKLIHTSNLYQIEAQEQLAKELCEISEMKGAFFTNSGTESSECAIKISRLFARKKGYNNPKVIVFDGAFHGRSFAGLSASSNLKVKEGFSPLLDGFIEAKFNDIDSLNHLFQTEKEIVAILIEPIQGESGINIAKIDFLKALREMANKYDCLLIFDEVQSGLGRTGSWFAGHLEKGVNADVITLAKPLGAGVAIGACLVNEKANLILPGKHGTTFGGSPLACQSALCFLQVLKKDQLLTNIQQQSKKLILGIEQIFNQSIYQIRAKGLMIGIEVELKNDFLKQALENLPKSALEIGLLINVTQGNVIRLLPPYIISSSEVKELLFKLKQLKEQYLT